MDIKNQYSYIIKIISYFILGTASIIILIYSVFGWHIDFINVIETAISISTVLFILYEKWLWQYDPFNNTPVLSNTYNGVIKYNHSKGLGKKAINVKVKQSLLWISITLKTDEISSFVTSANIVTECNEKILYYTYITNPKSDVINKNPINRGCVRLVIENKNSLKGQYWTASGTYGDIEFFI